MGRGGRSSSPSRSAPARSAPRSAPPPPAAARAPPPPAARAAAPAPAPSAGGGGGMLAGLGQSMASGMAMGVGSSIGRMAVNSMFGGSSSPAPEGQHAPSAPAHTASNNTKENACKMDHMQLTECLNGSNASNCDFYFTALQTCQANNDM